MQPCHSLAPIVDAVLARRVAAPGRVTVVGVGGSVAVGKSRVAHDLAGAVRLTWDSGEDGTPGPFGTVGVISTDALLRSNAELDADGLTDRKGFPESFDPDRSAELAAALHRGDDSVRLPEYSHFTYDLVPNSDAPRAIPDVCIIEGVVALQPLLVESLDVAVYVDADEADIERWFTERLVQLARDTESASGGFYAGFADAPPGAVEDFAALVWGAINSVNLRDHIAPSRDRADWIVRKGPNHAIEGIEPGARRHG